MLAESELNLADTGTISSVIQQTEQLSNVTLTQALLDGAVQVIAAANEYINSIPIAADAGYLEEVASVKRVSQGVVSEQLQQAAEGTLDIEDVVNDNTGAALAEQVAASVTPPTITAPTIVLAEAASAAGATAEFIATATNLAGESVPVTLTLPSGSLFAIGDTQVTASATEGGATSTATFTVRVQDTTAPEIELPASIVVSQSVPGGAT